MPARLSVAEVAATLATAEWTPRPGWVYEGNTVKIPGTCIRCGYESSPDEGPTLAQIRRQGRNACKKCGKRNAAAKLRRNDDVDMLLAVVGWEPDDDWAYVRSDAPVPGTCARCGYESGPNAGPRISALRRGQGACTRCSGTMRFSHDEAMSVCRTVGWIPDADWVYVNSSTPIPGTCSTCGTAGTQYLSDMKRIGRYRCQTCAYRKIAGLFQTDPQQAYDEMVAAGVRPSMPFPGRLDLSWSGICLTCGNAVNPRLHNVRRGIGACRFCANHGFDPGEPARLYVFAHDEMRAVKVGVTTAANDIRLAKYHRAGWRIVTLVSFDTGAEAELEQDHILALWRAAGYNQWLTKALMPMHGHTETAHIDALELLDLSIVA